MSPSQSEDEGTWTFYPTLLSTLEDGLQKTTAELAFCAHYCGRYQEAASIFEYQLPPSESLLVLALQRADMLTDQGLEHERIKLLSLALNIIPESISEGPAIRLLLQLMLADADFWAHGKTELAFKSLRAVKDYLSALNLERLSDTDVRTILLYHTLVDALDEVSNHIHDRDRTIFPALNASSSSEIHRLRTVLEEQKRWRLASVIMQYELKLALGPKMSEVATNAIKMCGILWSSTSEPLKFRSVILRRFIKSIAQGSSVNLDQLPEFSESLIKIMPSRFYSWKDFCPKIAAVVERNAIKTSDLSQRDIVKQLLDCAAYDKERQDFTNANQTLQAAVEFAWQWNKTAGNDEQESLISLKEAQDGYATFHEKDSRLAFFIAHALVDRITTLMIKDHNYKEIIHRVESFQEKYRDFAIPDSREMLLSYAMNAAGHRDMTEKFATFKDQYDDCVELCSFWSGTDVAQKALLDPLQAFRKISQGATNQLDWAENAIGLMLHWAAFEVEKSVLSASDCSDLFGDELTDVPESNLVDYLKKVKTKKAVSSTFFAIDATTKNLKDFWGQYGKVLAWVRIPNRLPSSGARLFTLRMVMEARSYRIREYLQKERDSGLPSAEGAHIFENLEKALIELRSLENKESAKENRTNELSSSVNVTLVKVFALGKSGKGLVTDSALIASAEDCRKVIENARLSGHKIQQYQAICQLIRLTWQRFLQFCSIPPESVMRFVNEADGVFVQIRNLIADKDPSETLVAGVKLSDDLSHREHHNYALAGRLSAFHFYTRLNDPKVAGMAFASLGYFLMWAYKSKGRGYSDLVGIEAAIGRMIAQGQEQTGPIAIQTEPPKMQGSSIAISPAAKTPQIPSQRSPENHILSPLNPSHASTKSIDIMLQQLPDDVVIVDFVDVKYAWRSSPLVAIMYRKGHTGLPVQLPNISLPTIEAWARKNLNVEKKHQNVLSGPDSEQRLAELDGLLKPLLSASEKSAIRPEETVVICPTGILNRIPLHAIPIDGQPFIERNAVVYCQSLSILQWLWHKFKTRQTPDGVIKRTVVNPMPELDKDEKPIWSTNEVRKVADNLRATFHHGFNLKKEVVIAGINDSFILHYHGHVRYDRDSALDSVMVLDRKAFGKSKTNMPAGAEFLTARDLFKARLGSNALATIIGCGSGVAAISTLDDILGLTTALFYAGAGAVVSTLWPLDDEDGAVFSREFYGALFQQRVVSRNKDVAKDSAATTTAPTDLSWDALDLAKAFRTAVRRMRQDPTRQDLQAAYHWASFTLNGFWAAPIDILPSDSNTPSSLVILDATDRPAGKDS